MFVEEVFYKIGQSGINYDHKVENIYEKTDCDKTLNESLSESENKIYNKIFESIFNNDSYNFDYDIEEFGYYMC